VTFKFLSVSSHISQTQTAPDKQMIKIKIKDTDFGLKDEVQVQGLVGWLEFNGAFNTNPRINISAELQHLIQERRGWNADPRAPGSTDLVDPRCISRPSRAGLPIIALKQTDNPFLVVVVA